MRKLQDWARNHPFKTISFIAIGIISGIVMACDSFAIGLFLLTVCYSAWTLVYALDSSKLLCVLVAATFMAVPTRAHAVQYALGGVVLLATCGLGYLGCRAINCAKKIPVNRGTNLVEEFVVAGEDCEYGAAFFWPDESCYQERNLGTGPQVPVVMTLHVFVESKTNCTTSLTFDVESQSVQDLNGLKEELAGLGLFVPDSPRISESYARNRHPVTAEQVPITFDWTTLTATIGGGGITASVEASDDLKTWRPLLALNVAAGSRVEVSDVSRGRQFYRVTAR